VDTPPPSGPVHPVATPWWRSHFHHSHGKNASQLTLDVEYCFADNRSPLDIPVISVRAGRSDSGKLQSQLETTQIPINDGIDRGIKDVKADVDCHEMRRD